MSHALRGMTGWDPHWDGLHEASHRPSSAPLVPSVHGLWFNRRRAIRAMLPTAGPWVAPLPEPSTRVRVRLYNKSTSKPSVERSSPRTLNPPSDLSRLQGDGEVSFQNAGAALRPCPVSNAPEPQRTFSAVNVGVAEASDIFLHDLCTHGRRRRAAAGQRLGLLHGRRACTASIPTHPHARPPEPWPRVLCGSKARFSRSVWRTAFSLCRPHWRAAAEPPARRQVDRLPRGRQASSTLRGFRA